MRTRKCRLDRIEDVISATSYNASFNRLSRIDLGLIRCRHVILAHNEIASISFSTVNECIEHLDLSHNRLEQLPDQLQAMTPNVKILKLQGNMLTGLPSLAKLEHLAELWIGDDLASNNIHKLDALPRSLRRLYARGNALDNISVGSALPCLEVVDVSWNRLVDLPFMDNVKIVRAAGNRLSHIPTNWLQRCHRLELFDITNNGMLRVVRDDEHGHGLVVLQAHGNLQATTTTPSTDSPSLLSLCSEFCSKLSLGLPPHLHNNRL